MSGEVRKRDVLRSFFKPASSHRENDHKPPPNHLRRREVPTRDADAGSRRSSRPPDNVRKYHGRPQDAEDEVWQTARLQEHGNSLSTPNSRHSEDERRPGLNSQDFRPATSSPRSSCGSQNFGRASESSGPARHSLQQPVIDGSDAYRRFFQESRPQEPSGPTTFLQHPELGQAFAQQQFEFDPNSYHYQQRPPPQQQQQQRWQAPNEAYGYYSPAYHQQRQHEVPAYPVLQQQSRQGHHEPSHRAAPPVPPKRRHSRLRDRAEADETFLEAARTAYTEQTRRLEQSHNAYVEQLEEVHMRELQALATKQALFLQTRHEEFKEAQQAAKQAKELSMELLVLVQAELTHRELSERQLRLAADYHNDREEQHERDMQSQVDSHAEEMMNLRATFEKQATAIGKQHNELTSSLRIANEELNEILMKQDQQTFLPSMFSTSSLHQLTDKEIAGHFTVLKQKIEQAAWNTWKVRRELWTERQLAKVCGRVPANHVQHAILQDMLWTILYMHLFGSPFRMFSGLGKQLEDKWLQLYGAPDGEFHRSLDYHLTSQGDEVENGFVWPPASVRSERWRYMTLIGCHDVLTISVSHEDRRAEVKRGWTKGQADLTQAIRTEIGKLVEPTQALSTLLQDICDSATHMWLTFSMHRCRFELSLVGSMKMPSEKPLEFREFGSLMLTSCPSLRRHGNAKGGELETVTVVTGCAGECVSLP